MNRIDIQKKVADTAKISRSRVFPIFNRDKNAYEAWIQGELTEEERASLKTAGIPFVERVSIEKEKR